MTNHQGEVKLNILGISREISPLGLAGIGPGWAVQGAALEIGPVDQCASVIVIGVGGCWGRFLAGGGGAGCLPPGFGTGRDASLCRCRRMIGSLTVGELGWGRGSAIGPRRAMAVGETMLRTTLLTWRWGYWLAWLPCHDRPRIRWRVRYESPCPGKADCSQLRIPALRGCQRPLAREWPSGFVTPILCRDISEGLSRQRG